MNLFDKFKKSKKEPEPETCPKCSGVMHLQTGLTHTFMRHNTPVVVDNINAMVCDDCGNMYFDWNEVERIREVMWRELKPTSADSQITPIE